MTRGSRQPIAPSEEPAVVSPKAGGVAGDFRTWIKPAVLMLEALPRPVLKG
jgi:hypothetical protein